MALMLVLTVCSAAADRFNTTSQRWLWASGSSGELRALAMKRRLRPVNVEVLMVTPRRYAALFVDNAPPNTVRWFWYEGLSFREMQRRVRDDRSRVIDLEALFPPKTIPDAEYTAVAVSNGGDDGKLWYFFMNVPASKIAGIVKLRKAQIVDLDTYFPNFFRRRLYSLVLVATRGAEEANSFFFLGNSVGFIKKLLIKRKARLVDIERHEEGVYSGVMEKMETPVKWFWFREISAEEIDMISSERALRMYDLEPYKMGGRILYDALMIENKI